MYQVILTPSRFSFVLPSDWTRERILAYIQDWDFSWEVLAARMPLDQAIDLASQYTRPDSCVFRRIDDLAAFMNEAGTVQANYGLPGYRVTIADGYVYALEADYLGTSDLLKIAGYQGLIWEKVEGTIYVCLHIA